VFIEVSIDRVSTTDPVADWKRVDISSLKKTHLSKLDDQLQAITNA
jgi:hypothetical protein